jgi:polyisoprenoid-binding protein YceI
MAHRLDAIRGERMRGKVVCLVLPAFLASMAAVAQSRPQAYVIDPERSDIHWLVYKAGAFARFGHNHVISAPEFTGRANVDRTNLAKSTFELEIPVMSLVVDDAALRGGLGEEFSSVPSADDIAGTRGNMLGERVLAADDYPRLRVTGTGPIGQGADQTMRMTVHLLGRSVEVTVPTQLKFEGDELQAAGEFELTHEQLGMDPFSVMAGALQVGNRMSFSYQIRAVPETAESTP